ncbi:MAG: heterocyst frequency control protein PatD [Timaviella obliquedivisa GSE-PSE-MK23-08B]|nr:heterocyst frequency control protein PatD [Timaviella obliquedivisa GSE-PSE-MK23-08B]
MEKHRQYYEDIRQQVAQLQAIAVRRQDVAKFQEIFLKVQQRSSEVDEELGVKTQSYQTEIDKQLRLLSIDLMFLKSARQPATREQRWVMMGDRLHLLVVYCDALLSPDF